MKGVFRYSVPMQNIVENHFSISIPRGTKILTVQEHDDELKIWVLDGWVLDKQDKSYAVRNFLLVETNTPIEENVENLIYIGSFDCDGFLKDLHLFEIKE